MCISTSHWKRPKIWGCAQRSIKKCPCRREERSREETRVSIGHLSETKSLPTQISKPLDLKGMAQIHLLPPHFISSTFFFFLLPSPTFFFLAPATTRARPASLRFPAWALVLFWNWTSQLWSRGNFEHLYFCAFLWSFSWNSSSFQPFLLPLLHLPSSWPQKYSYLQRGEVAAEAWEGEWVHPVPCLRQYQWLGNRVVLSWESISSSSQDQK